MNPENVLKRGYSITFHNGKAINSFKSVKEGDNIDTIVFDGNIHSILNHHTNLLSHERRTQLHSI